MPTTIAKISPTEKRRDRFLLVGAVPVVCWPGLLIGLGDALSGSRAPVHGLAALFRMGLTWDAYAVLLYPAVYVPCLVAAIALGRRRRELLSLRCSIVPVVCFVGFVAAALVLTAARHLLLGGLW